MKSRFTQRELSAHHEAGHALLALRMNVWIDLISIDPDRTGPSSRGTTFFWEDEINLMAIKHPLAYVAMCLAGPVAQHVLDPSVSVDELFLCGGRDDYRKASNFINWYCFNGGTLISDDPVIVEGEIIIRLLKFFELPEVWHVVAALAKKLLNQQTVTDQELVRFLLRRRANRLTRWGTIARYSRAVIADDELLAKPANSPTDNVVYSLFCSDYKTDFLS